MRVASRVAERHELGSYEISRKSLKWLDLMASTKPTTQKTNFDICAKNSEKSAKKPSI